MTNNIVEIDLTFSSGDEVKESPITKRKTTNETNVVKSVKKTKLESLSKQNINAISKTSSNYFEYKLFPKNHANSNYKV